MYIQSVQNNYSKVGVNPQFKSVVPVYYILRDGAENYVPVTTRKLTKILQGKIIDSFNKTAQGKKGMFDKEFFEKFISVVKDTDSKTRSYYHENKGFKDTFAPFAYILTGEESKYLDENFCKDIGRAVRNCPNFYSAEEMMARRKYNTKGLAFVKRLAEQFGNGEGKQALHVKFTVERTKSGNEKYILDDIEFVQRIAENNPFVKYGVVDLK